MRGMNVLVDCPQSSAGELRFGLFGVPIRIKFWFWIAVVVLCGAADTAGVLIWIAVCLASILIHEFGHVLAFRVYGERSDVFLYGWGGLTVPWHSVRRTSARLVTILAGPAAGFCAAAVAAGVAQSLGWRIFLSFPRITIESTQDGGPYLHALLGGLISVNLLWSLINLLPIFPFDGAHAAETLFGQTHPYGARRRALLLSTIAGGAMAALAMAQRNLYMVLAFLVLALSSAQAMEATRGAGKA